MSDEKANTGTKESITQPGKIGSFLYVTSLSILLGLMIGYNICHVL